MTELSSETIEKFIEKLASASPTPGGGSVAALSGALAAALGSMVCAIAAKKRNAAEIDEIARRLSPLREVFLDLARQDMAAFDAVMAAYRIPKGDPTRRNAIEKALVDAANVPLRVAETSVGLLRELNQLVPYATPQSVSDVGVAVHLTNAALESALLNVAINLAYMHDQQVVTSYTNKCDALRTAGRQLVRAGIDAVTVKLP